MAVPPLRASAAVGISIALHAGLLALLITNGRVRLELAPSPITLTLLEAADRSTGPGAPSEQLRAAPAAPAEIETARVAEPVEPPPKPVVVPAARPENPPPLKPQDRDAAAGAGKPDADKPVEVASVPPGGVGVDATNTAPAWSPVARVRYEELLFAWMSRHKQYPLLAQRRGIEGSGMLRVRIDRNGRVVSRALERSTGQALLDDAALDLVSRASPFPAVPAEYGGTTFEFVAPVEYRLR